MKLFPYFLVVFGLSVPLWVIGALIGNRPNGLPINLPISSLTAFCPLIAALILTYKDDKSGGIKSLLMRAFDYKRIKKKVWYIPVIGLMPLTMLVAYWVMRLMRLPLPEPNIQWLMIPVFFVVFFVGAIGEEVGWSGYAIDPMQQRWGALKASIILGIVWALWHVFPFSQTHHSPSWVAWQCLTAVGGRVLIVWLYNNTGRSVLATILYHATSNVSEFLFPNYGSHYNPAVTAILIAFTVAIVTLTLDSKTLAHYTVPPLTGPHNDE